LFRRGFQTKPMHIDIAGSRRAPTFKAIFDHIQTTQCPPTPPSRTQT